MSDDLLLQRHRETTSLNHDPFGLMTADFSVSPRVLLTPADVQRTKANRGKLGWIDKSFDRLLKIADELESLPDALPEPANGGINQKVLTQAHTNSLLYLLTDDASRHARAVDAMRLLARDYHNLPISGHGSRFTTNNLAESRYVMVLARAYDTLAAGPLSKDDDATFRAMIDDTHAILDRMPHRTCGNHQTWQLAGRMAVASALGDAQRVHDVLYGYVAEGKWSYGILHQLRHDFLADGMHWERTYGYHYYTLMAVTEIAMMAANIGIDLWHAELPRLTEGDGYDLHRSYGPEGKVTLKSAFDGPLFAAFANGDLPLVHDSGLANLRGQYVWGPIYCAAYDAYGDPRYASLLQMTERDYPIEKRTEGDLPMALQPASAFVDFARIHDALPDAPQDTMSLAGETTLSLTGRCVDGQTLLPDFGTVTLRADWADDSAPAASLYFGPHSAGHQSPAALNLDLYHHGRTVTRGPNSGGYEDGGHLQWVRTTIAHNTLTVDETPMFPYDLETESIWEADRWRGRISDGQFMLFQPGGSEGRFNAARARNQNVYPGVGLDRTIVLTAEYMLDVYRVLSDAEHVYDWAMHGYGHVEYKLDAEPTELSDARGYRGLREVKQLLRRSDDIRVQWRDGEVVTDLQIARPTDASIFVAEHPKEESHNLGELEPREPATMVIARSRGKHVTFAMLWSFDDSTPAPAIVSVTGETNEPLTVDVAYGSRKTTWWLPIHEERVLRSE